MSVRLRELSRNQALLRGSAMAAAICLGSLPATASVINIYTQHDVPEFTNTNRVEATGLVDSDPVTLGRNITYDSTQPCCVSGSARSVFKSEDPSFVADDEFGSRVEIRVGDAGAEDRTITAGGQIISHLRLDSQFLTFRISNTKLIAARGSTAKLNFDMFIHEIDGPGDADHVVSGPTMFEGQYEASLFGGNRADPDPSLTITQSGFQTDLPEPDFVEISGNYEWDLGIFEGVVDMFALGLDVGDQFGMSYNWDVEVLSEFGNSRTASASFFDPIGLEGGLALGISDHTIIPIGSTSVVDPSVVPLPAGVWLLGSGLVLLGFGRRRAKAA